MSTEQKTVRGKQVKSLTEQVEVYELSRSSSMRLKDVAEEAKPSWHHNGQVEPE